MKCFNCEKELRDKFIKAEPSYHFTSPGSINRWERNKADFYYEYFCDSKCKKILDKARNKFMAELDRNASDSDCFEHERWEKDYFHRNIRIGKCKITGKQVRVEPQQPGDNSGQPEECYQHWKLRSNYL